MRKVFPGERFPDGDRPADKEAFQIVDDRGNPRDCSVEGRDGREDGTEIPEVPADTK